MTLYQLYLESGPQRKKTLVHILQLLGCIANGPTTEEALRKTPAAIRIYLRFLQRHGEPIDAEHELIETNVALHVTEGAWLGNGDPALMLPTDQEAVTPEALERYIRHMQLARQEIVEMVNSLSEEELTTKPAKGRAIKDILGHIFGAEYSYMRGSFGKLEGVRGPGTPETMPIAALLEWMDYVRQQEIEKLRSLSSQELSEPLLHNKNPRTAHKTLRRTLEHEWEHLIEIAERLNVSL